MSLGFSITGAAMHDDWWASTANMSWIFSCICCGAVATSNPTKIESLREKLIVSTAAVVVGLPGVVTGLQLAHFSDPSGHHSHTDKDVQYTGFIGIMGGTLFMLLGPPLTIAVVRKLGRVPPRQLHYFLLTMLKSLPSSLGATLYVAAAAGSCLLQASDEENIIDQCGNPLVPTFFVTIFLGTIWVVGVILPFVLPPVDTGWTDIASMTVQQTEAKKITLVTVLSGLTVLLYAMTYEDGAKVTTTMVYISGLFCLVFCMLTGLTAYQVLRPMFDSYLGGARLSSGGAGDGTTPGSSEGGDEGGSQRDQVGSGSSQRRRKSDAFTWLGTSSSML